MIRRGLTLLLLLLKDHRLVSTNVIKESRGTWKHGRWQANPPGDAKSSSSNLHHRFECMTTAAELSALTDFHTTTIGANWINKWDISKKPCPCIGNWHGVECDRKGHIVKIDLSFNNLNGSLPASLSALTHLISIKLHSNFISGIIPKEYGQLKSLKHLHLHQNQLTPPVGMPLVPQEISNMEQLRDVFV